MFNNFPFLRILVLFNLFGMSLTACNGAPTLTAPELTSVPESTPIPSPTKTPTPTEAERSFRIDALQFSPDLAAALKKHTGLEASIGVNEAGNWVVKEATQFSSGEPQELSSVEIDASTLTENLTTKNTYGDTPTVQTTEGTTLYWIQEEKAWVAKEGGDIHNPVMIPYGKPEISARMGIVDHPEDFPQAAVERWSKHQYQNALGFQWREVNHNTGEGKKFGYLDNMSIGAADLTVENSPVQVLADDWYAMTLPDGTVFRYFHLKWLDPQDPRNPNADEWKMIQVAPGTEITENEANRDQFMKDVTEIRGNVPVRWVMPIIKADEGFFEFPNLPTALPIQQLSLAKLLTMPSNDIANIKSPNLVDYNLDYSFWINKAWDSLSKDNMATGRAMTIDNLDYKHEFFSQDFQKLIFPAFVMRR